MGVPGRAIKDGIVHGGLCVTTSHVDVGFLHKRIRTASSLCSSATSQQKSPSKPVAATPSLSPF
eukprot:COSAG01_NODE_66941_length_268_cov_1.195266_1_plen_63_part_01